MTGNNDTPPQSDDPGPDRPKLLGRVALEDQSDRIFDEVRRLVEHEDGLVDKRIAWMLAFNGFLFAAYGLSLGAEISLLEFTPTEPGPPFCVFVTCLESVEALGKRIETLRAALVIAGCLSALAALIGVWAAMRAMSYIRSDYQQYLARMQVRQLTMPAFPSVKSSAVLGDAYGLAMPCLVAVPWIYVWSKGYAGPLLWSELLDRSWFVLWGPATLLFVPMFLLRYRALFHPDDPHARHTAK
ncbi:hypothetical protein ACSSNL_09555 [Thalassobius sp. S69A]|uniref:hypothetical protein n=1 Tax=unclassified Thalassovita TaxID=2619711 RepID=UPI000C649C5A|nr:hypothetical protein [Paracoccaceae bacterium]